MKKLFLQMFKFGIVGAFAFLIDYAVLYMLTEWIGIYYLISSIISFCVSMVFNYILSIKWVFSVKRKQTIKEIIIFWILSIIGLLINQLVMYISVDHLNIYYMIAKLIATFIVMIWNFVTRKLFLE